jgi:hypothetical protein
MILIEKDMLQGGLSRSFFLVGEVQRNRKRYGKTKNGNPAENKERKQNVNHESIQLLACHSSP